MKKILKYHLLKISNLLSQFINSSRSGGMAHVITRGLLLTYEVVDHDQTLGRILRATRWHMTGFLIGRDYIPLS